MTQTNDTRTPMNPSGLCMCGCGQVTPIADRNRNLPGWVKGEHVRFMPGHSRPMKPPKSPGGLCMCGCGAPVSRIRMFLMNHDKRTSPVDYVVEDRGYTTPCWIWQRATNRGGYGQSSDKQRLAHRDMYVALIGPIPDGFVLDHLCRVRDCVNPEHAEPVTSAVNFARGEHPNAIALRTGICKRGHQISPGIPCIECARVRARERYHRLRSA